MKRVLLIAGVTFLAGWIGSCGLGLAVVSTGGPDGVAGLRDVGIIVLALLGLVPTLIALAAYGGLAWVVERFGGKAVAGLGWVVRKVLWAEGLTEKVVERATVRPVARMARVLTAARAFAGSAVAPLGRRAERA